MRKPADLVAVFQQARQLSLAYGGSTLRGHLVRLREHEAELLAGTHSCLQSQEQPGIDLLRAVLPNEAAVQVVYRAHLVSRSFVLAAVSADSVGGDRSQMEVLVAAAEQTVIDASRATALNWSLDVGPRFVSMPGTCVATGAAGAIWEGRRPGGAQPAVPPPHLPAWRPAACRRSLPPHPPHPPTLHRSPPLAQDTWWDRFCRRPQRRDAPHPPTLCLHVSRPATPTHPRPPPFPPRRRGGAAAAGAGPAWRPRVLQQAGR